MNVYILSTQHALKRGFNFYFPLYRWKQEIGNRNISIKYINDISKVSKSQKSDSVIAIDYRYIQTLYADKNVVYNDVIYKLLAELINPFQRKLLFDTADSTGSRVFWLTELFDVHVKKQLLLDKSAYLKDEGDRSYMPWIPHSSGPSKHLYAPLKEDQLHKLKIGWNIGMLDYRFFPFKHLYPFGTSSLFTNTYTKLSLYSPLAERKYISSFRGGYKGDTRYSFQRKIIIQFLESIKNENNDIAVGGRVSNSEYTKEMKGSKLLISPFGWGEICYRDFEAFINGCLLIKPDMSHLETYPNLYRAHETYIPVNWDMSNLSEVFHNTAENYSKYQSIACQAQSEYAASHADGKKFVDQLESIIAS